MGLRAGNHFELLLPFYANAEALHFDLGREVPQNAVIRRMKIKRGRHQQKARRPITELQAGEVAPSGKVAAAGVPVDPHPVIQRLQREVDVFGGFQLDDSEAAIAIGATIGR